jgi:hypothetical protein
MKKLFVFIILFSLYFFSFAKKVVTLKEINQPKMMAISQSRIFITEKTSIYTYSLKDFKFQKKFGKEGEGPREFKISHGEAGIKISMSQDKLLVNSAAKLSYYTHGGDFIKEIKVTPMTYFIPAGGKFVANGLAKTSGPAPNLVVFLWEGDFKSKKALFKTDVPMGMGVKISVPAYNFKYLVNNDKIFLASGKENIRIKVFNLKGNELYQVQGETKAVPMNARLKSDIINFYKTDPGYKDFWPYFKTVIEFPKHLPGLKEFLVDRDKIYVQTYEEKSNQYKWIIYDVAGKRIKSIFLPIGKTSPVAASPFTIHKGKYYYLKENFDSENWELFIEDL